MNRKILKLIFVVLVGFCTFGFLRHNPGAPQFQPVRPDLEYLKAINQSGPPRDPQLMFLLMAQYASANRQVEGAEFFTTRLKASEPPRTDTPKSSTLSTVA